MAPKRRLVIGCVEPVDIPAFGLFGIEARVDTGALTSALHVESLTELPGERVAFEVRPVSGRGPKLRHVAPVARRGRVRTSTGRLAMRLFVVTRVQIGAVLRRVEIGLVDRRRMEFPMLLGRSALSGYFVVDPALERTLRPPHPRAKHPLRINAKARKRRPGSA
jgi:hypothetical protein